MHPPHEPITAHFFHGGSVLCSWKSKQRNALIILPHIDHIFEKMIHVCQSHLFILLFFKIYLFYLFIFGCIGSSLLHMGFSLVVESRVYSWLQCAGFSLRWLLLLQSMVSGHAGFSSCGSWASVVVAHGL